MQERKPGCICQLDTNGEPTLENYAECPVHKPDAPDPKVTAQKLLLEFGKLDSTIKFSIEQLRFLKGNTKRCALINVNDILSILDGFQRHEYAKVLIPFYQNVKKEIESL